MAKKITKKTANKKVIKKLPPAAASSITKGHKPTYELLKQKAEALYLDTKLSQKQIANLLEVSETTLSKWANDGDITWEELRKLKSVGKPQALKKLYQKLIALAESDDNNAADSIIKVTNAIEKLSDRKITVPGIINTMMEFTEWLMPRDLPLAQKLNERQKEFVEEKLREPV